MLAILSEVEPPEDSRRNNQACRDSERVAKCPIPLPVFVPQRYYAAHASRTGRRVIDSRVTQRYCPRALRQAVQEVLVRAWTDRLTLTGRNSLLMQPLYPCLTFVLASRGPESKPIHRGGSPGRERLRSNDCNSRKYARRTTV